LVVFSAMDIQAGGGGSDRQSAGVSQMRREAVRGNKEDDGE